MTFEFPKQAKEYRWLEIGLLIIAFFTPLYEGMIYVGILIMFVSFTLNWIKRNKGKPFPSTPLNYPLQFMILVAFLSVVNSEMVWESFTAVLVLAGGLFIVYHLIAISLDERLLKNMVFASVIAGSIVSIIGIAQYTLGEADRAFSTMHRATVLGGYLVIILPITASLWLSAESTKSKLWLGIATGLMGLCLVFTYARSAWLGIASAVIALAFIKKRKAPVIILILILVIITLSLLSPSFVQRLISITDTEEETITDRFDAWQGSLAIIRAHPLTGIGLNSFPYVYPRYMPFTGRRNLVHAHNIFFQLGVEMGLLSVLSFIWLLIVIFGQGISALRNISAKEIFAGNKTQGSKVSFPYLEGLIGGILAGLVGFMIQEQFNFGLVLNDIVIFFWANIALLMAACRLAKVKHRNFNN